MSTNQNLPRQAGFKITTINGKRCTAVPRANVQAPSEAPSSAAVVQTTAEPIQTSIAEIESSAPSAVIPVPSSTTEIVPPVIGTPEVPSTPTALRTSASVTSAPTPEAISDTSESAVPALKAIISSSNTQIAVVQSERRQFSTVSPSGIDSDNTKSLESSTVVSIPTSTHTSPAETTDATLISASSNRPNVIPVVSGVLGSVALIAIIGVIFFFCRRRRKNADSLLTPLGTGTREKFYEIDNGSVGPTRRSNRWKQELAYRVENAASGFKSAAIGIGSSLKSTVSRDRSDTPSVNLNRGNSQFFHGPVPQHSRNNSSILSASTGRSTVREKFEDWWERFTEGWRLQRKGNELVGPFANGRSMSEKQATTSSPPNFSQLVAIDDREMQLQAQGRRASLSGSPNSALLHLDARQDPFADPFSDPFADPIVGSQTEPQHWKPPNATNQSISNPFADPITAPTPSVRKSQTYVTAVRRSRGSSYSTAPNMQLNLNRMSLYRPPSGTSRYPSTIAPSTIAPSHDSDRDTVFSSYSGGRRGKGRSDPFDLERPDLWRPPQDRGGPPSAHQNLSHSARMDSPSSLHQTANIVNGIIDDNRVAGGGRDSANMYLNPLRMTAEQQRATYAIRYSSGVDSLGEWGDPGPDLGDRSVGSSLRGNASSHGGSGEYDRSDVRIEGVRAGGNGTGRIYSNEAIKGSLMEIRDTLDGSTNGVTRELETRRAMDNVSPVSALSVQGVGKAV